MLKYKRKRLTRIITAVIVPLFFAVIVYLLLYHPSKVGLEHFKIISKFKSADTLTESDDKKTASNRIQTEEISADEHIVVRPIEDSMLYAPQMVESYDGKGNVEYLAVDTLNLHKDELMAKKTYLIPVKAADRKLDSLLMGKSNSDQTFYFTVEFWASPIHFSGYKRSANKAIIFGISDIENCELNIVDHNYYLILNNSYFLLELSDSFKDLEEIKQ